MLLCCCIVGFPFILFLILRPNPSANHLHTYKQDIELTSHSLIDGSSIATFLGGQNSTFRLWSVEDLIRVLWGVEQEKKILYQKVVKVFQSIKRKRQKAQNGLFAFCCDVYQPLARW